MKEREPKSTGRLAAGLSVAILACAGAVKVLDKEGVGCDAKLSSPLSWVVCPTTDAATSINNWIFGEASNQLQAVPTPQGK